MSIDSDIQAMIDASIPPSPDLSGIQSTLATLAATVADQEVRIAALEGTTPPPPPSGLPVIPSGLGSKLRVVPAVDGMGPFGIFRYPDDHIGGSGQLMTVYTRYSNAYNGAKAADGSDLVSVHDGFIELRCVKRPDGLFDGAYIGSAGPKRGGSGTFTASPTATIRWWLQFSKGQAVWPTAWLYDVLKWSANEIDWPEEYGGKIHGNLHPGSAGHQRRPAVRLRHGLARVPHGLDRLGLHVLHRRHQGRHRLGRCRRSNGAGGRRQDRARHAEQLNAFRDLPADRWSDGGMNGAVIFGYYPALPSYIRDHGRQASFTGGHAMAILPDGPKPTVPFVNEFTLELGPITGCTESSAAMLAAWATGNMAIATPVTREAMQSALNAQTSGVSPSQLQWAVQQVLHVTTTLGSTWSTIAAIGPYVWLGDPLANDWLHVPVADLKSYCAGKTKVIGAKPQPQGHLLQVGPCPTPLPRTP